MRIVPFPRRDDTRAGEAAHAELAAALDGEGEAAVLDYWHELRADVRALAPAMTSEFERELGERLVARGARGLGQVVPLERVDARDAPAAVAPVERASPSAARPAGTEGAHAAARRSYRRLRGLLGTGSRRAVLSAATVAAVLAAVLVASPLGNGGRHSGGSALRAPSASSRPAIEAPAVMTHAAVAPRAAAAPGGAASSAPAAGASGRVQQRAATLSLAASPTEVPTVADRVARLATSLGGFVQSSQIQVLSPREGTSHAELDLRLPSAKLTAALASLGQLAAVRSESQSLQDITNAYDAARQRLGDVIAERQALLRALAHASTEGEIDSLRERLSQARRAVAEDQSAFRAVARRASTSEVEVTVLGDAPAASEGLTLHRALREAGKVLVVTVTVVLIALAILAPLALLLLVLTAARRAWLRYRRERALDAR
jgi:hypothetical protein